MVAYKYHFQGHVTAQNPRIHSKFNHPIVSERKCFVWAEIKPKSNPPYATLNVYLLSTWISFICINITTLGGTVA